ncbi:hypothetical protein BCF59_0699 [Mycoplasmopsis mustelae]|uniref:DUF2130 domain-containing protein n=1 Tax=Mycoplasmopsis mustelae TaxID=171289 RepID=A0A4R7UDX6_9BACT|nr:DUF2130 domain-containing protein [Mycoplasmopsis mustelae]TDV22853.1 hypothetical protein BCF59_0699 [Mycoplasmopsis mustelae]
MQSKKVKITIKNLDKLEFYIQDESVANGDYFSINDLLNIDTTELVDVIAEFKQKMSKAAKEEIKKELLGENSFKVINSPEYIKLQNEQINKLEKLQKEHRREIDEIRKNLNEQFKKDKKEIIDSLELKQQDLINSAIELNKTQLENKIQNLKNILENKDKDFEIQKNKIALEMQQKYFSLETQYEVIKKDLENTGRENEELKQKNNNLMIQVDTYNKSRNFSSTKEVGEVFEDFLLNLLEEAFDFDNEIEIEKSNIAKEGKKPDFEIRFLKKENNTNVKMGTVIIEAKNRSTEKGTKKNKDFLDKLEKDRRNYQADYAILVTELEPDKEIYIQKVAGFEKIYIVRYKFLVNLVKLLRDIIWQKSQLIESQIEFNSKQEILTKFDKFIREKIEKNILIISKKIESMKKSAETIIGEGEKIRKKADEIVNTSFSKIQGALNTFDKSEFIKSLSKLERKSLNNIQEFEGLEIEDIKDEDLIDVEE